ncbi:lipopolysaccharide biosynthesis protein [Photobacterium sanguinicancri]|uniref:lipopolysaccharide biosynthesis protein n=1 Tax=Photobacterium sanguinicancri TaxID=875932 RepID=UPI0021C2BA83|nr:lipopolysaccharide biosynthesis protein [Photobacterium sanguinicancri]
METINRRLFYGVTWSFFDKLVNQLSLLAVTVYLANRLGPEVFGLIGILTIFLLLAESIVTSGLGQALIQKSVHVTLIQYSTVFISNIVIAMLMYVILYLASPHISSFYSLPELEKASQLLFTVLIINSISVVYRAKLSINMDFKSIAKASFIGNTSGCITALLLVNMGEDSYTPIVWMSIVRSFGTMLTLRYYSSLKFKLIFDLNEFISLFKFGYKLLIAGILSVISNNLYTLIIGRVFDTKSVGYYSQSANLTNTLSGTITSILQGVSFPVMSEIKNNRERLVELYARLLKITMLVVCPVMFGFAGIAEDFTLLFLGSDWLPIINLLVILSLSRVFTPISALNMNVLNAVGRSDLYLKTDLIKLPISLSIIVISALFGIYYLAIGNLVSTFIAFYINSYYPGKLFGVGFTFQMKLLMKPLIASIIMFCMLDIIDGYSGFIGLGLKIIIGILSYVTLLVILRESELSNVVCFLKNKFKK